MIPVTYSGDLSDYDHFVSYFKQELKNAIERGYIGNLVPINVGKANRTYRKLSGWQKKKYDEAIKEKLPSWRKQPASVKISAPKEMICDDALKFFYYAWGWIDRICNADPERLLFFFFYFESEFDDIKDQSTPLYHDVKNMFVTHGYGSSVLKKGKLIEATGIKVCPYCNRGFVANVGTKKGSVRGQLDHFYPKEKYPYLAVSRYNLVPSCSCCNSSSGKGDKDPKIENIVSPFDMIDAKGIRFESSITRGTFVDMDHCAESIKVRVDSIGARDLSKNIETFNLEPLYNSHVDYVAEMYFKYCKIKTSHYKKYMKEIFGKVKKGRFVFRTLSMNDWKRIVFGVYTDDKDFGKRPMSKFCEDLLEDFERKGL